jgi:hypothetical protein
MFRDISKDSKGWRDGGLPGVLLFGVGIIGVREFWRDSDEKLSWGGRVM